LIILPYAHEEMFSRRRPIVTPALMIACFVSLVVSLVAVSRMTQRLETTAREAMTFYEGHPYLTTKPPLDQVLLHVRVDPSRAPASPAALAVEQEQLDGMNDSIAQEIRSSPNRRFGYVPSENNALGLLTYQFMHEGWLHLLGNMWFLLLCGINLENKWGRAVFLGFYLSAGVVAALAYKVFAGGSLPLIGASGAIAGAMGAFLVSFARTRIKFVWIPIVKVVTFTAPAYVMLPLWLATQVLWAWLDRGGRGGVAYVAHIGGFLYGVAFAGALRLSGLERRLDLAVEGTVSVTQDPEILRAAELTDAGKAAEAIAVLEAFAAQHPASIDAQLEALRAAKVADDRPRELGAYARLVSLYLGEGHGATAIDLYLEMRQLGLHHELPADLRRRLAGFALKASRVADALGIYEGIFERGLLDEAAVRAAMECATHLASMGRRDRARELYEAVRSSPFSTAELDMKVDQRLRALDAST
jgi:membrane associated rhomboid family serine protease